MGLAPLQTTSIGVEGRQHGGFGIDKQRCAVFARQVRQAHVLQKQLALAVGQKRGTGQWGRGHGVSEGLREGREGVRICGKVARSCAAGSVGR